MSDAEDRVNFQSGQFGESPAEEPEGLFAEAAEDGSSSENAPDGGIERRPEDEKGSPSLEGAAEDAGPPVSRPSENKLNLSSEPPSGPDPDGSPDETLGRYLRRHREAKGITIEQLAATTKIKDRIIAAIEADHYDEMPPVPVVRGFLKTIAAELALRPPELLSRFEELGIKGEVEQVFPEWTDRLRAPSRNLRSWIPALALLFLVVGGGYLFYSDGWKFTRDQRDKVGQVPKEKTEEPARPRATQPEPAKEKESDDSVEALASKGGADQVSRKTTRSGRTAGGHERVEETPGKSGSAGSEEVKPASMNGSGTEALEGSSIQVFVKKGTKPDNEPLVLKITAKEDTWLRVVMDGSQREEIFLLEGESRRWEGAKTFVLTVGNASTTQVELNGLTIQLPKTKSNLVRDFLISKNNLP